VLWFGKEAIRKIVQRRGDSTDKEKSRTTQVVINMAVLTLAMQVTIAVMVFLFVAMSGQNLPNLTASVFVFLLATVIENLAEPY
jgi:fatty acid desaturase